MPKAKIVLALCVAFPLPNTTPSMATNLVLDPDDKTFWIDLGALTRQGDLAKFTFVLADHQTGVASTGPDAQVAGTVNCANGASWPSDLRAPRHQK
jgi:hypothetical protein